MASLTPGQQVIKIVYEELKSILGTESPLSFAPKPPTLFFVVGLQGGGKTTFCGKLALFLSRRNHYPLLVAGDPFRAAAGKQIEIIGKEISVPTFGIDGVVDVKKIVKEALQKARESIRDVVIVDTRGRLHIDEELIEELISLKVEFSPQEILLVCDAMTGQDAVNIARTFNDKVGISGVVLTKLDGDARGGAALSIREVTGRPIKFVGTGEKPDKIEIFYPERIASRILGMGDVLTLIEKVEAAVKEEELKESQEKIARGEFGLNDFLSTFKQMRKVGAMSEIMSMLPWSGKLNNLEIDEKVLVRTEAIISSMTTKERVDSSILNASRRRRIAKGSGTTVNQVNQLLKQFELARKMVKQFGKQMNPKEVSKWLSSSG